ncbi:MAG TPA: hypothetical protein DCL61_15805, partial [Cyanobacteria bacterium UBA12227]|nr:hypothetical protein [Cyanobacteria bacterium UBA12227]
MYYVNSSGDVVEESPFDPPGTGGIDLVISSVDWTLNPEVENLTLSGSQAKFGFGNFLNNVIIGNELDNRLEGNEGDDTLTGNGGGDELF